MGWKHPLKLSTVVFADATHNLVLELGEIGDVEREGQCLAPGREKNSALPLHSRLQLRRTYDGLPRVSGIS